MPNSRLKVLLAEDYDDTRALLTRLFEEAGWEVAAAKDGREALYLYHRALHDEKYFNLLLLDIDMPRLNGFAVGVNVRNMEKFGDVPRSTHVYLTGHDKDMKVAAKDLVASSFADAYIRKPIDPEAFLTKIHDLVAEENKEK